MRISDWSSDVCSSDLIGVLSGGVVRRLARDRHVMDMAFTQARIGDADKAGALLQLVDRMRASIAHRRLDPADKLMDPVLDRKSAVSGNSVSVRVDLGGRTIINTTIKSQQQRDANS